MLNIKEELAKVKSMNGKQRWSYYKSYYLAPTIIGLFVVACLAWFLYDAVLSRKQIIYSGGVIGVGITDEGLEYLSDGYLTYLGGNPKKQMIAVTKDNFLTVEDEAQYGDQSMDMALYTQIAVGEYDFFIMGKGALENYAGFDCYLDPSNVAATLGIEDRLVCPEDSDVPYALDITDIAAEKLGAVSDCYLVFINVKNVPEEDIEFSKYLLEK